ncbi:AAA family ATPase [Chitinophaga sancti]|uniref:AAA ATPase domain-containing protein n=1 Tax=Chitinophaga sancti TaxID=1004 RepID=A0A1K1RX41_9BACT|nr:AAA family ATPase [Chitinophaga sancti]WQD63987.1 AAA family ATPase [Chitinophaga sancti]WQG90389.1 AAA family ATPase [Chitinophaga sancti]SFW76343.1 AAA ATPase domain-containing protein [Chitinophaga sancti]
MELLFLWIEDFRRIRQQPFNFSGQFDFTITDSGNSKSRSYIIEIGLNENYQNIFPPQVSNITGIVGKNGSGKSTLMHCLKMMYGQLPRLLSPLIFSFLDLDKNTIYTYYYQKGGLSSMVTLNVILQGTKKVQERYIVAEAKPYSLVTLAGEHGKTRGLDFEFANFPCAFLSSNFDSHREEVYNGILNQSTRQRLDDCLQHYILSVERSAVKQGNKKKPALTIDPYPSHLRDFYKNELRSNIRFIAYANKRKTGRLPNLPTTIVIRCNFEDYEYLLENFQRSNFFIDRQNLEAFHKRAGDKLFQYKDKKKAFYDLIYLSAFYYALRYRLFKTNHYTPGDINGTIQSLLETSVELFAEIGRIMDGLAINEENKTEKSKLIHDLLGTKLFSALSEVTLEDDPIYRNDFSSFQFKVDDKLWNLLDIIFDFNYGEETSFLDFNWGDGLSTGEEALLNHFSRLYEIKKKIRQKPLLLLIDEGDLYFHPQWQKHYINDLVNGLKFIFSNNKVQVILSTHSPFIVSDLPKQNLLFLKKNITGQCIVADNEIQTETFGANIHELFTDSFFLSDGLMGEYSRLFIVNLIEEIKKEKIITIERFNNTYKNKVGLVGESFIKTKILELIASRADFNLINKIIDDRSAELDMLKKIRNQKSDDQNRDS